MKAMILAAGLGTRLRPLTDSLPKPLLQINGEMLIERHLRKLAAIDVRDVVINVSHLAEKIQAALGDGSQYGVRIHYSYEPVLLETAGGVIQALPLLGSDPFLLISADILTDYPFENLRLPADSLAHLVCVENPEWHPEGDFGLEQHSLLKKQENKKSYTYASFGLYSPQLLAAYPPGKRRFTPIYEQAIQQKQLTGEVFSGLWHNIGTLADYENAKKMMSTSEEIVREVAR